jgi:exodeoxyribonuclease VII large subunit
MNDLFEEDPAPGGNAPEFTVSEISGAVKRMIEGEFGFVRVRGEISRVSRPASGHLYFDLKDEKSVLGSVCWKGQAARLAIRPEEGMEVIATGRLTTFPGASKYQMVVEDLRPAGQGALMAMLEKRRKQLEAEGLFAAARKRPLPWLPEVIGVVTSPSGAVIRDILHRLRERFPRHVLIWPVAVQGEKCAAEVARAIAGFNALPEGGPIPRPDLLIVARGGGSIEDLWGFNEEIVVRAAAASRIPLISAVGHETDTTLIDLAADLRAPTPTAAAELAVPVRLELLGRVEEGGTRLARALNQALMLRRQRLRDLGRALPRAEALTETARQRLDRAGERLDAGLIGFVRNRHLALARTSGSLRPVVLTRMAAEARRRLADRTLRLGESLPRRIGAGTEAFAGLAARLDGAGLRSRRRIGEDRAQAGKLQARAGAAMDKRLERAREAMLAVDRLRQTLGYTETLRRGYAVVRGDGAVVTTVAAASAAQSLELEFADGRLALGPGPGREPAPPARKPRPAREAQGSLFQDLADPD